MRGWASALFHVISGLVLMSLSSVASGRTPYKQSAGHPILHGLGEVGDWLLIHTAYNTVLEKRRNELDDALKKGS